ncbi:hypothetical protein CEXT_406521 [Caerostris extrusa]|uniref:Uncharacterized protein n=1 Tax=Caerostris extrusa TaxID=172846 RepID=A0AAV4MVE6_CAEEX|nr:hypothetical protein CEXT_406521 [Caerostris extrusa]
MVRCSAIFKDGPVSNPLVAFAAVTTYRNEFLTVSGKLYQPLQYLRNNTSMSKQQLESAQKRQVDRYPVEIPRLKTRQTKPSRAILFLTITPPPQGEAHPSP